MSDMQTIYFEDLRVGMRETSRNAVTNLAGKHFYQLSRIDDPGLYGKLSLALNSHRQVTATQRMLIEIIQKVVADNLDQSPVHRETVRRAAN